ncbi:MAG: S9 family peptidase [bacterium]|jgi:dipeptidyl aminopeptidase/acylaminoacyl peptidase
MKLVGTDDLYEIVQIAGFALSRDGARAAFAQNGSLKNNKRYQHIYVGAAGKAPRQFTRGDVSDGAPKFSIDGREIYFISKRGGDKSQLYAMPVDGGEPRRLTDYAGNVAAFYPAPDGRHAIVQMVPQDAEAKAREEKKKRGEPGWEQPVKRVISRLLYKMDGMGYYPESRGELHYISLKSGKGKRILDGKYSIGSVVFSPDGRFIYFDSNRSKDPDLEWRRIEIYRMPVSGRGGPRKIDTFDGPKFALSISPDGKWLAYAGEEGIDVPWGTNGIYLYKTPTAGGKTVCLTKSLDRVPLNMSVNDTFGVGENCDYVWSPDGAHVYFNLSTNGCTHLYRVATDGKSAPEPVIEGEGVLLGFGIDFAKGIIHYVWSDNYDPCSYFTAKIPAAGESSDGASGKRVYFPNRNYLGSRKLGKVESFWFKGKGGRLQGWILYPPDFNPGKKYPAILEVHGGPKLQYANAFFHEFQYLAAQGYIVLFSNPRGGQGYGKKHVAAINGAWGTHDFDDVMSFADHCVRRYKFIDAKRLGITGGSYGGYMTCWAVGHTDRFRAAVTQRCVSNFISFFGSSDVGFHFKQDFGGATPWEGLKKYAKQSPVFYAKNFKTPCLVIHSENDLRCPIEQGEQFYVALKLAGVPTQMIRFPEESHGMSRGGRTDRRIERLKAISGWFDKYL